MWGMKICSTVPGHMTMPIHGEKLQKFSSSGLMKLGIQHWVLKFFGLISVLRPFNKF